MPVLSQSLRASMLRNAPLGSASRNMTCVGVDASTATTLICRVPSKLARQGQPDFGSRKRCQLHTTSADVSGAPLWNVTPSRRVKV